MQRSIKVCFVSCTAILSFLQLVPTSRHSLVFYANRIKCPLILAINDEMHLSDEGGGQISSKCCFKENLRGRCS